MGWNARIIEGCEAREASFRGGVTNDAPFHTEEIRVTLILRPEGVVGYRYHGSDREQRLTPAVAEYLATDAFGFEIV